MVRRLVEHQHVRFIHQQAREPRPHHPTAGKLAGLPLEICLAKTEARENLLGTRERLAVRLLVVSVRHGQIQDRLMAARLAFLRQVAEPRATNAGHFAGIWRFLSEKDL